MSLVIAITSAVVPAILLVYYIVKKDRFPEPTHMVLKTFFFGVLICNPVLIAEFAVQGMFSDVTSTVAQAFVQAFLVAGLCEEGFKFLVLHKFCAMKKDFDEPMDGMVYGVVASLGFATLENVLYVLGGGMDVALARAATAVPAHACFGGLMGYFYAKAHFGTRSIGGYMMALAIPIVAHGIYNFPLFMLEAPQVDSEPSLALQILGGFILYVVCLIFFTGRLLRRLRQEQELLEAPGSEAS